MLQQTHYIISLSGYVPLVYNVDIILFVFLLREYVIFFMFTSYPDTQLIEGIQCMKHLKQILSTWITM